MSRSHKRLIQESNESCMETQHCLNEWMNVFIQIIFNESILQYLFLFTILNILYLYFPIIMYLFILFLFILS